MKTTRAHDPFDLAGRTVLVTGGAGLLGYEYGRALVAAGANVVLADLDEERVMEAAADLHGGGSAIGCVVDVTDETSVAELVSGAVARFGRIDALVNNAAVNPSLDRDTSGSDGAGSLSYGFEHYPLRLWNRALAVNLTGMFLCAREVAPAMLAQKRGVIVNVSSTYGLVGPDQRLYASDDGNTPPVFKPVDYSVTKSGVIGLTKYLAAYWAGTGIRVNTLTPGGVLSQQPPEFVRRYSERTPIGRMADRHEYGGALRFLLSDAASYMTGGNLVVDGGWTAW